MMRQKLIPSEVSNHQFASPMTRARNGPTHLGGRVAPARAIEGGGSGPRIVQICELGQLRMSFRHTKLPKS
jgi:hypothetical protein